MRQTRAYGVLLGPVLLTLVSLAGCASKPVEIESTPKELAEHSYRSGLELAQEGRQGAALAAFHRAAGLDPLRADVHYRSGLCHYDLGEYDLEAAEYRKSLAISPNQPKLWRALALACVSVDDLEGARRAYVRANQLEPSARDLYNLALVEADLGRGDEARALLRRCLEEGEASVRQKARQSLLEWGASGS
ncbi:MAG: tetratricopeptide repeat protein [Planctomycetes bacterium]|nr:tetratricopeptide repeat protein [Planctomycetota bacterium]